NYSSTTGTQCDIA
nr:Chain C, Anastral spindle 2 [Drosophila melanogaster]